MTRTSCRSRGFGGWHAPNPVLSRPPGPGESRRSLAASPRNMPRGCRCRGRSRPPRPRSRRGLPPPPPRNLGPPGDMSRSHARAHFLHHAARHAASSRLQSPKGGPRQSASRELQEPEATATATMARHRRSRLTAPTTSGRTDDLMIPVELRFLFFSFFLSRNRSRRPGPCPDAVESSRTRLDAAGADADVRPVAGGRRGSLVVFSSQVSSHLISSRPCRSPAPLRRALSSLPPSRRPVAFRQPGRRPTQPPPLALPLLEPCKMLPVLVTNKPVTLRPLQLRSRP